MRFLVLTWLILAAIACRAAFPLPPKCDPKTTYALLASHVTPEALDLVGHYYEVIADPEKALGVNLKTLSQDLRRTMTPAEIRDLTRVFHDILTRATRNPDGSPNAFAVGNVSHVALHYRDIEASREALREFFRQEGEDPELADVALLNAAAHDVGKIARNVGLLTPSVQALYDKAVQGDPKAFLFGTVLGHDGLTMDGIRNIVQQEGARLGWNDAKIDQVTRLLQAASARHNAGYSRLTNDPAQGTFHFWQTMYPGFAARMRAQGAQVADEYPAAQGGWMPAFLAMVDRGTALHPSFVEKIMAEGGVAFTPQGIGGLLKSNARSVREEIDSIAQELGRHSNRPIADFPLYRQYQSMARSAERMGEEILRMNDFTTPFAGRPDVPPADREGIILYRTPDGSWYKVHKDGLLQKYTNNPDRPWEIQTVPSGMNGANILMQRLIGYPPIDTSAPRTSQ